MVSIISRLKCYLLTVVAILSLGISVQAGEINLKHLYTVDKYDGNHQFTSPVAVFFDAVHREIYVADAGTGMIVTLDRKGHYLGSFSHWRRDVDRKVEPTGIAVNSKRTVFVADVSANRIWTYDYLGNPAGFISIPRDNDSVALPGKMAINADDDIYIVIRNAGKVVVLDANAQKKTTIGNSNIEACCDVALDGRGSVYLLSRKGDVVHMFGSNGSEIRKFGIHSYGNDGFAQPSAIDIDSKGRIWIADSVGQVAKVFDSEGTMLGVYGGMGSEDGDFFFPVDLCIDRETNTLFVIEKNGHRLQAFAITEK
ncbi:MAG: NHL repeat-containing protein [Armatimonadota bacterium]